MLDFRKFIIGFIALVLGVSMAVGIALGAGTTDTNVSCATVSSPDHTVGVDGTDVTTISGTTTSACNTQTYTIPTVTSTTTETVTGTTPTPANYDQIVLNDKPVAYWDVKSLGGTESDITGHGNTGTYQGSAPITATMPNGDPVDDFNISSNTGQYMTVPSSPSFSIPTTKQLTWEAWIRPDVLQFAHPATSSGYVDFLGKCQQYSPTCEWEGRMYSMTTAESPNRPNRISSYAFNLSAGLGSAGDWQPGGSGYPTSQDYILSGHWYHVVGEFRTDATPYSCSNSSTYPGVLDIWVDGVLWNESAHNPTGCMSQHNITPTASTSPLAIGTMAFKSSQPGWFQGAIGKVAIYNYLLSQAQISSHYQAMTGNQPGGSCASTCTLNNP